MSEEKKYPSWNQDTKKANNIEHLLFMSTNLNTNWGTIK